MEVEKTTSMLAEAVKKQQRLADVLERVREDNAEIAVRLDVLEVCAKTDRKSSLECKDLLRKEHQKIQRAHECLFWAMPILAVTGSWARGRFPMVFQIVTGSFLALLLVMPLHLNARYSKLIERFTS